MKNLKLSLLLFSFVMASAQAQQNKSVNPDEIRARTEWFRDARFGMFIHWGAYSIPARGEWVKSDEEMTTEQYQKYVNAFVPSNYKPTEWAQVAKKAGMKYAVMTAKHHDGFCLFDSKYTDYKASKANGGRDFIKEYVTAFRQQGVKVGFYYSLIDWHHPDYPNVGNHPLRNNQALKGRKLNWDNYLKYMHKQIEELMTNYGKIDVLWLDYSFDDYEKEKWKAEELVKMIRKHQPNIILNNRLIVHHGVGTATREFVGYGDYETPEQSVPETKLSDTKGRDIPWETCLTMNNSWGYNSTDHDWKDARSIIHTLTNCVSKNGNLLLNVGPDAQGTIPPAAVEILSNVGKWLDVHGESIYGCHDAPLPKPEWGYYTQKGNNIYAHWTNPIIGHLNLRELGNKIDKVTVLTTNTPGATSKGWFGNNEAGNFFINIKTPTYKTYILPDKDNTVFKLELKK